jgi:hypothetical protein
MLGVMTTEQEPAVPEQEQLKLPVTIRFMVFLTTAPVFETFSKAYPFFRVARLPVTTTPSGAFSPIGTSLA